MQYAIIAAGLAATAFAAYEAPPVYAAAPAYNTTEAPYYPTEAPAYYTTEEVTAYTTYCPYPTTVTWADKTYTVTEATTLTLTECPGGCVVTKPVYTKPAEATHPVAPVYPTAPAPKPVSPVAPAVNTTKEYKPVETAPVKYTGAASAVSAGAAGLLAVFGLVAAL